MKQEERREQTIKKLLDTVKSLVNEKGCNSITMQDIMERSELSKGAIFHYIKSKDELFIWVLQERLEETNRQFRNEVNEKEQSFSEPMKRISESITFYENPEDATNKILLYLLGKEDQPMIAEALKEYYERTVALSQEWIEIGQQHGVISPSIDSHQMADMFVLLTMGIRMRASIPNIQHFFDAKLFSKWIAEMLQSPKEPPKA
ncbi:TetR/AcrR family transcriptional regulator [Paenibacillus sp. CFBP13512]|uniref:TetR/AcrR family transcriptional regulator n=1 Tax=Paenibacillus sp. CFBP13512 TaxID=2184007 RepID=UPI0010C0C295|nr:TetR/AcrR family transcriptional regulator [Paenibacillus sp. CFBP13512]TKJ90705.1 TetR/AcrR family transcriptional regulator [Paenibacillus sp. CFBP13512]